jgi:lipopolysaccharide export system protein LptA
MYDKTKNNVRLEQNVKAVIENNQKASAQFMNLPAAPADNTKKTKTTITCDAEVEFNYSKNEGYFNKNVHVVNDEGTIDADRLTVYLDQNTKTVKTIVAEGNVKIQRGENMTYSDKATYIEADKKIVLEGAPKLVIYQEGDVKNGDILGTSKK